jgi:hypothetical protein
LTRGCDVDDDDRPAWGYPEWIGVIIIAAWVLGGLIWIAAENGF